MIFLFSYLGLSVFLPEEEVVHIFGKDLLADAALTENFAALCGLGGHKPFECVGEIDESRAAVMHLRERRRDSPVINALGDALRDETPATLESCLQIGDEHFIPRELWEQIRAIA